MSKTNKPRLERELGSPPPPTYTAIAVSLATVACTLGLYLPFYAEKKAYTWDVPRRDIFVEQLTTTTKDADADIANAQSIYIQYPLSEMLVRISSGAKRYKIRTELLAALPHLLRRINKNEFEGAQAHLLELLENGTLESILEENDILVFQIEQAINKLKKLKIAAHNQQQLINELEQEQTLIFEQALKVDKELLEALTPNAPKRQISVREILNGAYSSGVLKGCVVLKSFGDVAPTLPDVVRLITANTPAAERGALTDEILMTRVKEVTAKCSGTQKKVRDVVTKKKKSRAALAQTTKEFSESKYLLLKQLQKIYLEEHGFYDT